MRKLLTIDDITVALVTSLGYGYGEAISRLFGWPDLACVGASLVLGVAIQEVAGKIAFSEAVQKRPLNRVVAYAMFLVVFLLAQYAATLWMGVSMVNYLLNQLLFVVGMPILGFVLNLLIRAYRVRRIRRLYGDGAKGYVFDVSEEDVEEANRQNKSITADYDADCAVRTSSGVYVGEVQKKVAYYMGIPFAKPPVGELRWKAPEPLPASDAVFEAANLGASAVQADHVGSLIKLHRQSEDCLYLNVCVGTESTREKRPVLVLFHHGDFTYGGSADPLLAGDNFVRNHPDIVFVSFNYRLGIFGFIDFAEVPGGDAYPDAPNLGLLDQVAALRWVHDNIAAFGGDPDRVTVIGFGAGASSISLLAASGRASGLFQRAFVFYGSPDASYETPDASRALAADLLRETGTTSMAQLAELDTQALKEAAQRLWPKACAPTCDGSLIPTDVLGAYEGGVAASVDFVVGIPGNEGRVQRAFVGGRNFQAAVTEGMAEIESHADASLIEELQGLVAAEGPSTGDLDMESRLVELYVALCVYRFAVALAKGGSKVHLMWWGQEPLIANLGSGTVDAAATLLGNGEASEMYGSVMNDDLSVVLQALLSKFACEDALRLYTNEVKGVDAIDWKELPQALVVADGEIRSIEFEGTETLCSLMQERD